MNTSDRAGDPARPGPAALAAPRRPRPGGRQPVKLFTTDRCEAWVIGWMPGQGVELHDHGDAAGALAVIDGTLVDLVAIDRRLRPRSLSAGTTLPLPPGRCTTSWPRAGAGDEHPRLLTAAHLDDLLRRSGRHGGTVLDRARRARRCSTSPRSPVPSTRRRASVSEPESNVDRLLELGAQRPRPGRARGPRRRSSRRARSSWTSGRSRTAPADGTLPGRGRRRAHPPRVAPRPDQPATASPRPRPTAG